jgi:hypothetical protein
LGPVLTCQLRRNNRAGEDTHNQVMVGTNDTAMKSNLKT